MVNPNTAASFVLSGYPTSTVTGSAHTFVLTAEDAYGNTATGYTGTVKLTSTDAAATFSPTTNHVFVSGDGGVFTYTATFNTPAATQTLTATDTVHNSILGTTSPKVQGLAVTSFTPTAYGFTATFNKAFDATQLNLYTSVASALGVPDVTLVTGSTTYSKSGSLLVNTTTNTITFIKTAGVVAGSGALPAGTTAIRN